MSAAVTRKKKNDSLFTVAIAMAGVFGQAPNTYGGTAASCTMYDTRLECYLHRLIEGGMAIDKRPVFAKDMDAAFKGVVSGPMLNAQLPPMSVDPFMGATYTVDALPADLRSLDTVSTDLWCAYWEALGARVGKRVGDAIMWNDGTIEPITVPSWYKDYEEFS